MTMSRLGERMRERRKALGLTLKNVAEACDLSVGLLSQVERQLTVPSLASLATIAKVLCISVGDLVGHAVPPQADTYACKRQPYRVEEAGQVRYERLSNVFRGSVMHSVKFTMPCGYKSEIVAHEGEEMIFVLRGRICYIVAKKRYVLDPGDSLHFDAKIPHGMECLPNELGFAEVIWTGTLDMFDGADREPAQKDAIELRGTEFAALCNSS